jgi:hypothetical protein
MDQTQNLEVILTGMLAKILKATISNFKFKIKHIINKIKILNFVRLVSEK